MAEAVGSVRIDLFANLAEWTDGLNKAEGHLNRFARNIDRTSKAIVASGQKMTLGLTAPILAFGGLALKASADAESLRGDVMLSFGDMADEVNAWAETTGDAFGRSTQTIQRAAISFQQLFEDIAPNEEAAAQLSMRFTELSQDFAAFNNVSSEQGVKALQGALAGAGKAVKRLGVDISDAAVEQKAFELGIASANVELTEQQKTLARAAIIAQGFSKIQGDIKNDQDEATEKTARLREEFQEMQVALGDELLPVYKEVIGAVLELVRGFKQLSPEVKQLIIGGAGIAAALGPAAVVIGTVGRGVGLATKLVTGLSFAFLGAGKNADTFGGKLLGLATRVTALGAAAYTVGGEVAKLFDPNVQGERNNEQFGALLAKRLQEQGVSAENAKIAARDYFLNVAHGAQVSEAALLKHAQALDATARLKGGELLAASIAQTNASNAEQVAFAEEQATIDELIRSLGDLGGEQKDVTDEFAQLKATLDPIGTALTAYKENVAAAVKLGYDQSDAQRVLGRAFVDNVGDVEGFRDALKTMPPEIQAIVARQDEVTRFIAEWARLAEVGEANRQLGKEAADAGQEAIDAIMDYGASLTAQFDPMAVFAARLRGINEAFAIGAISAETYAKAKAAAFAETPEGQQQIETIRTVTDELTSAAMRAQTLGDAIERMILEIIEAQVIRPFIQNAVSSFFPDVSAITSVPTGGGFDLMGAANAAASFFGFGETRDKGGPGFPGTSYRISSGVAEDFVPSMPGHFVRGPGNETPGGNVTFNVYADDPNAFRASERQMVRRARRDLGV